MMPWPGTKRGSDLSPRAPPTAPTRICNASWHNSIAGNIGYLPRRGKAGSQYEGEDLGLGKRGVCGHQTFLDGTASYGLGIDTAPVVSDRDKDAVTRVPRGKVNGGAAPFRGGEAGLRRLDA